MSSWPTSVSPSGSGRTNGEPPVMTRFWGSVTDQACPLHRSNVSATQNDGTVARTRMMTWFDNVARIAVSSVFEKPRKPPTRVGPLVDPACAGWVCDPESPVRPPPKPSDTSPVALEGNKMVLDACGAGSTSSAPNVTTATVPIVAATMAGRTRAAEAHRVPYAEQAPQPRRQPEHHEYAECRGEGLCGGNRHESGRSCERERQVAPCRYVEGVTDLDPCEQGGERPFDRADVPRLCMVRGGEEEPSERTEREQRKEQLDESAGRSARPVGEEHPGAQKNAYEDGHQTRQLVLTEAGDDRDEHCKSARDTQLDRMLRRSGSVRPLDRVQQAHRSAPGVLWGVGGVCASRAPGGSSIVTDP